MNDRAENYLFGFVFLCGAAGGSSLPNGLFFPLIFAALVCLWRAYKNREA